MKNHDTDLFFMARNGDIEAYEKLIESYEKKIFSLIFAAVGDRSRASELTQDIFVKVYKDLCNKQADSRFPQLVYGTARNLLVEIYGGRRLPDIKARSLKLI